MLLPSDAPFDAVAADYDRSFTHCATGRLQRAVVQAVLAQKLRPGAAVLELNCGTGEDACWLAGRGCSVWATDLSPEMVAHTAKKARDAGLSGLIRSQVLDLRNLPATPSAFEAAPAGGFDLLLSNFGGLNCLSPGERMQLGHRLPALLRPGGLFVAVVMGRFCWWETLYFLLKRRPRAAFRRLSRGPVPAPLDARTTVPTWYCSPAELRRSFPALAQRSVQPAGFWLPPSYLDPWFAPRPRLLRGLGFLETKCRGRVWAEGADHFLGVFEKPADPAHKIEP